MAPRRGKTWTGRGGPVRPCRAARENGMQIHSAGDCWPRKPEFGGAAALG